MNNIWVVSDWHFNHDKNFIWENRGFSSVIEMNEAIIERHNKIVNYNDIVYVLGDCMLGELQSGLNYIRRLNGKKYLAYGNHCTNNRLEAFTENHIFEDIQFGYRIKAPGKRHCILTHYPTIVSNEAGPKMLNLFGHTHQTTSFYTDEAGTRAFMYNVGMDAHNCTPVNLEDVIAEIKAKEI